MEPVLFTPQSAYPLTAARKVIPVFNNEVYHLKVLRASALGYEDDIENLQTPVHP
jgi:hypothetical protein